MAGYQDRPLPSKLGIKGGCRVTLLGAPDGFDLGDIAEGVRVDTRLGSGPYDVMLLFSQTRADLEDRLPKAKPRLHPAGGLWVCWPKAGSELTEDVVREVVTAAGLHPTKATAMDEAWQGLRGGLTGGKKK